MVGLADGTSTSANVDSGRTIGLGVVDAVQENKKKKDNRITAENFLIGNDVFVLLSRFQLRRNFYQSFLFSYPNLTTKSPATSLNNDLCSAVKNSRQPPVFPERKV